MFIADVVRTLLPNIIPPSYKGSNIRYLYSVKSAVTGGWLILENGQSRAESTNDVTNLVGFAMTMIYTGMYLHHVIFMLDFLEMLHENRHVPLSNSLSFYKVFINLEVGVGKGILGRNLEGMFGGLWLGS